MLEKTGVDFSQYRYGTLRRRIGRRMGACACSDVASYLSVLDLDPSEPHNLLHDVTIKYTEFFRDPWVFDIIGRDILPSIVRKKRRGEVLSIWSAGCATGEETYSLAALIRGGQPECEIDTRILGTDLDPEALAKAEAGIYPRDLLPRLPEGPAARFFAEKDGNIIARRDLRELVQFRVHDLTGPAAVERMRKLWPHGFDLICCRNVLMYLRRSVQHKVLEMCWELLAPYGFLVLGTGEIITRGMETRLHTVDQKARIYRRAVVDVREVDAL